MLIWLMSDPDSSKHLAFREMLADCCSHFPSIKAEFAVKTRSSLWESVFAHLRDSKRNPLADIMEIPHNWTALLAKLGLLSDLSKIFDDFNPLVCPEFIIREFGPGEGGAVFSAPWWMESPALFYGPAALKAMGGHPGENGLSWEEFSEALEKLSSSRRAGGRDACPLSFPASSGPLVFSDVLPRVWSRGGGLFLPDLSRASFNKDETAAGIRDFLRLAINGHSKLFSSALFEGSGYSPERQAFAFSPRDLCSAGPDDGPAVHRPPRTGRNRGAMVKKSPSGMLPFPGYCSTVPGFTGGPVNISNLAVFSGTADLKETAFLLRWLLKPERAGKFASAFSAFPCHKAEFEERLERSGQGALYRRIFSGASLRPNITVYPTAEVLFERILWNMSLAVARRDYSDDDLTRELIIAQGEADYLLSLY